MTKFFDLLFPDGSRPLGRSRSSHPHENPLHVREIARGIAWGVERSVELLGEPASIHITESGLGFSYPGATIRIFVNPRPILGGRPDGPDLFRALLLHEIGHHLHDFSDGTYKAVTEESNRDGTRILLNALLDERLERRLRSRDARWGALLARMAVWAFAQREARSGRDPASLWLRTLRMGVPVRPGMPKIVTRALAAVPRRLKHCTLREMADVARELKNIFEQPAREPQGGSPSSNEPPGPDGRPESQPPSGDRPQQGRPPDGSSSSNRESAVGSPPPRARGGRSRKAPPVPPPPCEIPNQPLTARETADLSDHFREKLDQEMQGLSANGSSGLRPKGEGPAEIMDDADPAAVIRAWKKAEEDPQELVFRPPGLEVEPPDAILPLVTPHALPLRRQLLRAVAPVESECGQSLTGSRLDGVRVRRLLLGDPHQFRRRFELPARSVFLSVLIGQSAWVKREPRARAIAMSYLMFAAAARLTGVSAKFHSYRSNGETTILTNLGDHRRCRAGCLTTRPTGSTTSSTAAIRHVIEEATSRSERTRAVLLITHCGGCSPSMEIANLYRQLERACGLRVGHVLLDSGYPDPDEYEWTFHSDPQDEAGHLARFGGWIVELLALQNRSPRRAARSSPEFAKVPVDPLDDL